MVLRQNLLLQEGDLVRVWGAQRLQPSKGQKGVKSGEPCSTFCYQCLLLVIFPLEFYSFLITMEICNQKPAAILMIKAIKVDSRKSNGLF